MKLNKKEKTILINYGYSNEDIQQIEHLKYTYILCNKNIEKKLTKKETRNILTIEEFLTGIARSAFHKTSCRNEILIESNL